MTLYVIGSFFPALAARDRVNPSLPVLLHDVNPNFAHPPARC
jgi:hypothetical protein